METDAGNYEDRATNRYANEVMEIIQEECDAVPQERKLKAVIATIAVSDAAQIIKDFQEGDGDILIVKMMASAGLDIARLKVALDLSTVRTDGSFVQRVMRIATRWERDGRAAILKALYITPDDCLGQELYQRLIYDQGGGGSAVEWEDSEEIETSGNGPPQFNLTEYEPIETRLGNVLQDEDGSEGPGSLLPVVDNLMSDLSHTTREIGKGRMSSRLYEAVVEAAGVMIAVPPNGPTASPEPSPATADGDLVDKHTATKGPETEAARPHGEAPHHDHRHAGQNQDGPSDSTDVARIVRVGGSEVARRHGTGPDAQKFGRTRLGQTDWQNEGSHRW